MILEISILIRADTFPGLAVPFGNNGNGLIYILVSLFTSTVFLVSHEVLIVTRRGFQHVGSDQIDIQNSFNNVC